MLVGESDDGGFFRQVFRVEKDRKAVCAIAKQQAANRFGIS
jgi:hypothetical protein